MTPDLFNPPPLPVAHGIMREHFPDSATPWRFTVFAGDKSRSFGYATEAERETRIEKYLTDGTLEPELGEKCPTP